MTPLVWISLLQQSFGVQKPFACKLWRCIDATPTMLYQLGLLDMDAASREVSISRLRHLGELLLPSTLVEASARVYPEDGRRRNPEALAFEEAVLQATDKHGAWIW
jgi:hypothetical protein